MSTETRKAARDFKNAAQDQLRLATRQYTFDPSTKNKALVISLLDSYHTAYNLSKATS